MWRPSRVARKLPPHDYAAVWVVAPEASREGEFGFLISQQDVSQGDAPTLRVTIARDFQSWQVKEVQ
jgi:hypothetical protein